MVRVLRPNERGDGWLVRQGDKTTLDVPGGRVTLELNGGWSESGIAYTRLSYEPIRAGLVRFGEGPGKARYERQELLDALEEIARG